MLKFGVIGAADIAYRRFLPALKKNTSVRFIGIASRDPEKAQSFANEFGGKKYGDYEQLLSDTDIDAVYIPLPPALHYHWAKRALESGKHVLLEKPSTTNYENTEYLVELAKTKNLTLNENYMFLYHRQLTVIQDILNNGEIGKLRLIRAAFGFPRLANDNFRYNMELGGGALLDCGGYPVSLAALLLGEKISVTSSNLCYSDEFGIDLYGSVSLENTNGEVAQISFGMDNYYKCELELWGSTGYIKAPRIFTAPPDYDAPIIVETSGNSKTLTVMDDQFLNSIEIFCQAVNNAEMRERFYLQILRQIKIINEIKAYAKNIFN